MVGGTIQVNGCSAPRRVGGGKKRVQQDIEAGLMGGRWGRDISQVQGGVDNRFRNV